MTLGGGDVTIDDELEKGEADGQEEREAVGLEGKEADRQTVDEGHTVTDAPLS